MPALCLRSEPGQGPNLCGSALFGGPRSLQCLEKQVQSTAHPVPAQSGLPPINTPVPPSHPQNLVHLCLFCDSLYQLCKLPLHCKAIETCCTDAGWDRSTPALPQGTARPGQIVAASTEVPSGWCHGPAALPCGIAADRFTHLDQLQQQLGCLRGDILLVQLHCYVF